MKRLLLILFLFSACGGNTTTHTVVKPVNLVSGTAEMTQTLQALYDNGNPRDYYHWNKKLSNFYLNQISQVPPQQQMNAWFQFCLELLNAGEPETCILEIEKFISDNKYNYAQLVKDDTLPIMELLALAHLRLGEVRNCQENHNEHSCILPLKKEGQHTDKAGSEKAIELYTLILEKYPRDKFKWLLNVAYMTLGEHPSNVPPAYLIPYPNHENKLNSFPAFKEVAMQLGVAENGLSGGVCLDDFNNDGLIDIFATAYGMLDQCKLFLNTGKGFRDATESAGLIGIVSGLNCIHADYDNDGNKDIFILRGGWLGKGGNHPNSLLRNNGDGTFSDVTKSAGLLSFHPTQTATWGDVNKDGYLDLFIGNESSMPDLVHACELYVNQKDGTFKEAAVEYNLSGIVGFVKGVSFGDFNNDHWPDLYVSMMGQENLLFKNEKGKFTEIGKKAGVNLPKFSFPCWFFDVNNDGFNDIFVSSYDTRNIRNLADDYAKEIQGKPVRSDKSKLFINNGDETFSEQSVPFNLDKSMYSMGCNFGDIDNDGWLDFYLGTGAPDFSTIIPNRMFRNNNGKSFEEVTASGRFGHIQKGHGIGFADFDNDGDQDIYAVMGGAFEGDEFTNVYFENPIDENNWIVFELEGIRSNRNGIGARLKLEMDNGREIYHTINTGGSFGANSLQAEIGLGKGAVIKTLSVAWPNSEMQVFNNIDSNKKYRIVEGDAELKVVQYEPIIFEGNDEGHHHHHHH